MRLLQVGPGVVSDLAECTVPQIVKQKWPLRIGHSKRVSIHLRIDMSVGDKEVSPPVIIEVEELNTETQEGNAYRAEAGRSSNIGELTIVVIVIEIVRVVGEVGLDDVRPRVMIVVGRINAHARLFAPIRTVRDAD